MNIELMTKVRDHVVAHPEQHDQSMWAVKTECGTTACAAGWTLLLGNPEVAREYADEEVFTFAGVVRRLYGRSVVGAAVDLLGIDMSQADMLFVQAVTREGAVAVMNELIETDGQVDWRELEVILNEIELDEDEPEEDF